MRNSITPIHIDFNSRVELFKQVANAIRGEIESGRLPVGAKLPSTRNLAVHLKVSRATTSAAYRELVRLGLIESPDHGGTYVRHTLIHRGTSDALNFSPDECDERDNEDPTFSALSREPTRTGPDTSADAGFVDASRLPAHLLPVKRWNQHFCIAHGVAEDKLRLSLASYLRRSRSVVAAPQHIVVFGNERQALFAVNSALLRSGDVAAVEHPGEPEASASFKDQGAILLPIESDGSGLLVERMNETETVKLIYTSPTNQHPTGTPLSLERRLCLLNQARQKRMWIVENDADHEFTYSSRSIPALKSLDENSLVVYIGSFCKSLSPLTNISFVVAPPSIAKLLFEFRKVSGSHASGMEQYALACVLEDGHLERHLRQLRQYFSERRRKLIEALAQTFGRSIFVHANAIGTILCVRFANDWPPGVLSQAAQESGLPLLNASRYYGPDEAARHLLISIAHVDTGSIAPDVARLSQSILSKCVSASEYAHMTAMQAAPLPNITLAQADFHSTSSA